MIRWLNKKRSGPIGVDLGSRSVKLVQLDGERTRLLDAARWDMPSGDVPEPGSEAHSRELADAIRRAYSDRNFHGRNAVLCLGQRDLFLQNIRVPKTGVGDLSQFVHQEAAGRLPFSVAEAEIRFIEAGDVRQGETTFREVILIACHRPLLEAKLQTVERAGLHPVAVDVEPLALLRAYSRQYRRDEDRNERAMFVHVGYSNTVVVIAQGADVLFAKYLELGGCHMDEEVARHLDMRSGEAAALRRHNGDRRSDQQDPEIARSVAEAIRPVIERLANELSLCIRYHSVTFRGQPLARLALGGGEATPSLVEQFDRRLNLKCELGDPLRTFQSAPQESRRTQWDVATGLALWETSDPS